MNITIRDLMKVGAHLGHLARFWNPKMQPYIFTKRAKLHIIDLDQTLVALNKATAFLSRLGQKNSKVLFVGTKRAAQDVVREEANRCGMPYIDHRWLGGTLTNYKTVRQSVKRLKDLEISEERGLFARLPKKEALGLSRDLQKLRLSLSGIKNMGGLPDALFVVDVKQERIAIQEANRLRIPVIAIVDSNSNPDGVDYVIPANDDSTRAIQLYLRAASDALLDGKAKAEIKANAEKTAEPAHHSSQEA